MVGGTSAGKVSFDIRIYLFAYLFIYYLCVYVGEGACCCHTTCGAVTGQIWMPVLDSNLAWDRVSLPLSTFYARIQGPWTSGDYPVFSSHLVVGALGLHTLSIFFQAFYGFNMVLMQAPYPLRLLSAHIEI